jgi:cytochrome c oxidase cbb3-type subunit 2
VRVEKLDAAAHLRANRAVGVPYTDEMIAAAQADLRAQADPEADASGLQARYPNARAADFDGDPARITEMDALIAYLQKLGRDVDFAEYQAEAVENLR